MSCTHSAIRQSGQMSKVPSLAYLGRTRRPPSFFFGQCFEKGCAHVVLRQGSLPVEGLCTYLEWGRQMHIVAMNVCTTIMPRILSVGVQNSTFA